MRAITKNGNNVDGKLVGGSNSGCDTYMFAEMVLVSFGMLPLIVAAFLTVVFTSSTFSDTCGQFFSILSRNRAIISLTDAADSVHFGRKLGRCMVQLVG